MSAQSVKLTRKQLHREIWKTPIHRLSEKYGLSDVGLAKVCKRMNIPRPPRGYWRRKETGAAVHEKPLPKPKEGTQLEIEFHPSDRPARGWKRGDRSWNSPPQPLGLVDSLLSPGVHPLVNASWKHYEEAKEGKDGILKPKAKNCVPISVSRDQLERSLRLLDAVFRAWEEQGHRIEIRSSNEGRVACMCAGEDAIEITIVEEVKEIELDPTEEELLQPKWTWKRRVETRPLLEAADKWNRAQRLREFIDACEAEIVSTKGSGDEAENWTAWARRVADGLDPLKIGYLEDAGASILSTRRNDSR